MIAAVVSGDNPFTVIAAIVFGFATVAGASIPAILSARHSREVKDAVGEANGNGNLVQMQERVLGTVTEIVGWTQHHDTRDDERFGAQADRITVLEANHTELRDGQAEILATVQGFSDNVEAFMSESRADREKIHAGGAEMIRYGNAQLEAIWGAIEQLGGHRPTPPDPGAQ